VLNKKVAANIAIKDAALHRLLMKILFEAYSAKQQTGPGNLVLAVHSWCAGAASAYCWIGKPAKA
jgi:hypothetical protein